MARTAHPQLYRDGCRGWSVTARSRSPRLVAQRNGTHNSPGPSRPLDSAAGSRPEDDRSVGRWRTVQAMYVSLEAAVEAPDPLAVDDGLTLKGRWVVEPA